jgi:hypothetical protein
VGEFFPRLRQSKTETAYPLNVFLFWFHRYD